MSEHGVFAMDRGWFDHPAFKAEAFSEREAYLWVLMQGQSKAHPRYLSQVWRWKEREVNPFVRKMVASGLFVRSGKVLHAVDLDEANPHPGFVVGESWRSLRLRVLARDRFTCVYCGATDLPLHCDHVMPRSRGGMDVESNLVAACAPCNSSKRAMTPEEWMS